MDAGVKIYGAGVHSLVVMKILDQTAMSIVGVYDDGEITTPIITTCSRVFAARHSIEVRRQPRTAAASEPGHLSSFDRLNSMPRPDSARLARCAAMGSSLAR